MSSPAAEPAGLALARMPGAGPPGDVAGWPAQALASRASTAIQITVILSLGRTTALLNEQASGG